MKPIRFVVAAALMCVACICTPSFAQDAHSIPLDAATLAQLPRETVDAEVHGKALHCSGVSLAALLRKADAMPEKPLHGGELARIVRASARDGYGVAFSLAELDATLGNTRVFVVDRCDGKPLDEHDGPLRLLVPDDARPARGLRQLQSLDVMATS